MSRHDTTVGHILSLHFHDLWKYTSEACNLYHVELCDILLCWLARAGTFNFDLILNEFKKINLDVTENFSKFQVQANPRRKGNIAIRIPSHCFVKFIASKAKVTQERVIVGLLASIYLNEGHETFEGTVSFIKDHVMFNWAINRHNYYDLLKTVPNYQETRRNRR